MNNVQIAIIDYGMGNITSIKNIFSRFNCKTDIVSNAEVLKNYNAIILPGVGAFGQAMKNLSELRLIEEIKNIVKYKNIPILGICLGMQLLADASEENGFHEGLGLIPGIVKKINVSENYRLPHVGWNSIEKKKGQELMLKNIANESCFYFVHSYEYICDPKFVIATTTYEKEIIAALKLDNIFGVQFHPERSQSNGLKLIENFLNYLNI